MSAFVVLRVWCKADASHLNVSEATGGVYLNKLIVLGKHQHNLLILQALSSVMMSAVGFPVAFSYLPKLRLNNLFAPKTYRVLIEDIRLKVLSFTLFYPTGIGHVIETHQPMKDNN